MSQPLTSFDPEIADIIEHEMARQFRSLELIASENFTSRAVLDCLGSALTNKYAEGEIGSRYYGGTEYMDKIESLAKSRALQAFGLNPEEWGVNVQPYSGSPANFAVYTGLLTPHSRIMGLGLNAGGHLTHGFYTSKRKISASSIYFESLPYQVDFEGRIDYEHLEKTAEVFLPSLIILGASAYARDYDYERVRGLCDRLGCYLMMDMAHTAGLIAGGVLKSPFPFADVVTTTTHKSLRGPRSALIFFRKIDRKGVATDLETKINQAVFPGLQGGPHMHQIAAVATQMKDVCSPEWKKYAIQVKNNSKALCSALMSKGYKMVTGGTDNHLCLWDVRSLGLTGGKMEKILEDISISVNKNTIPTDPNVQNPGGVRLGVCALTSREMKEKDMEKVAEFLEKAVQLALEVQQKSGPKLKDFADSLKDNEKVIQLRNEVEKFATQFPIPGFDASKLKYKDGNH